MDEPAEDDESEDDVSLQEILSGKHEGIGRVTRVSVIRGVFVCEQVHQPTEHYDRAPTPLLPGPPTRSPSSSTEQGKPPEAAGYEGPGRREGWGGTG